MNRLSHIIRLLSLALAVSGCRSAEKSVEVRAEYRTALQRDSIRVDCTDTIYLVERGDTVRVTEIKVFRETRYQMLRDTIRTTDTIVKEKVTSVVPSDTECRIVKMKANRWKWFAAGFGLCFLFIFAAVLIKKFVLK